MNLEFKISGKQIGEHSSVFIVAEISANHGQSFKRAVALIRAAKKCGADAVKFQTFTPDTITLNIDNKYFRIKQGEWGGQTLYKLYSQSYTPWEWFKKLKEIADDLGLIFFSTVFDKTSVDFLEGMGVAVYKVASHELVDLPLIEYVAKTKKPLILSTGMATTADIGDAVKTARKAGANKIAILKCVSTYPAKPEHMNLRLITDMQKRFKCIIGFSDHSLGTLPDTVAVALGAKIIEKHFTLSRKIKTLDNFFSIEPREFRQLVDSIRLTEEILGEASYKLSIEERQSRLFRRSLFVVQDIKKGDKFSENNVKSIRPGYGVPPQCIKKVLGKIATKSAKKGTPLSWNLLTHTARD